MSIPPNALMTQAVPPPLPTPLRLPLRVVVSVDVEEEGLFSGRYTATQCGIRNVRELARLIPLSTELGFPLTLLCSHAVFADVQCCRVLERLRDHAGAEIGAHLHHWSTPPFTPTHNTHTVPARTHTLPLDLLTARLHTLLEAGKSFHGAPLTSFRMGRWDLKASVRPLLAHLGIKVDSSVCPLRAFKDGPDHFLSPTDPYWPVLPLHTPPLLEVPLTQVASVPVLAKAWYALWRGRRLLDTFHYFGALSPNPVWHNDTVIRWATRIHRARGGRVVCLFWHSSELLPGGSPHIPDQAAADRLYARIRAYLVWLREHMNAQGVTLSTLATPSTGAHSHSFPHVPAPVHGDW